MKIKYIDFRAKQLRWMYKRSKEKENDYERRNSTKTVETIKRKSQSWLRGDWEASLHILSGKMVL